MISQTTWVLFYIILGLSIFQIAFIAVLKIADWVKARRERNEAE